MHVVYLGYETVPVMAWADGTRQVTGAWDFSYPHQKGLSGTALSRGEQGGCPLGMLTSAWQDGGECPAGGTSVREMTMVIMR